MKILLVHNYYTDWCGEDAVFEAQTRILRAHGHEVGTFVRRNAPVARGLAGNVRAFCSGFGNPFVARALAAELDAFRPEVVHVHNVTPMISPLALCEVKKRGIPLVMTAHQYRLTCPESHHLRQGKVCTECVGKSGLGCIRHNCWGNMGHSVAHAGWHFAGASLFPFKDTVDALVVLSEFQKAMMLRGGWPAEKLHVVHNPCEGEVAAPSAPGGYFAYVGRVSAEKGLPVLLEAARRLPHVAFKATGDAGALRAFHGGDVPANVAFTGRLDRAGVADLLRGCRALVLPSLSFEGQSLTLIEAAQAGRAAICSDLGSMPETVVDGRTGLVFPPGDAAALAAAVDRLDRDPDLARRMGEAAQGRMGMFSPATHAEALRKVYAGLLAR